MGVLEASDESVVNGEKVMYGGDIISKILIK